MSKIAIGLSGGVDSSVAAYLLKQQGHQVVGVFMRFWHETIACNQSCSAENKCCNAESYHTIQRLCIKLDIPLHVFDFEQQFKRAVVDKFIKSYQSGQTPNPCVWCNEEIKFKLFYREARKKLKIDYIATGHYARLVESGNHHFLHQAADNIKDQTYFLYRIPQNILKHTIFPLGDYTKTKIKSIAQKKLKDLNLHTKSESQDLCFVPSTTQEFLQRHVSLLNKPGNIVNQNNQIIGRHQGLINYTLGQRKGIGIGGGPKLYVTELDARNNIFRVGDKDKIFQSSIIIQKLMLPEKYLTKKAITCNCQIRFGNKLSKCIVKIINKKRAIVTFAQPQFAPTPGQHCVFYHKNFLIGGGEIKE